ncbi:hypothetical protein EC973_005087 [Apophysomyces ossiformis]|uniref:F-box domain-containing protein n=1 Tax=Apophysomyces ossiformis TaxID=679940 RepID=A0A8H7BFI9_9FUNG|nr:hypothetical protein EC973_005087 [Apophysomyces ossiformis]
MIKRDFPPEVIDIVLSWLPRLHVIHLLTVNRLWFNVAASRLYRNLAISTESELVAYINLFYETGKQRKTRTDGFYSPNNYAAFVRCIDLSKLCMRKPVSDEQIDRLTADCTSLESLNIYNCHYVHNDTLTKIFSRSPLLKHLNLAGVSDLDASSFLQQEARDTVRMLQSLDIYLVPGFFRPLTPRNVLLFQQLLPSLRTLTIGGRYFLRHGLLIYDVVSCFYSLSSLCLNNCAQDLIRAFLRGCSLLRYIKFIHCKLGAETMKSLPRYLLSLQMDNCTISEEGVKWLRRYDYQHITTLGFKRTKGITEEDIQYILRRVNLQLNRLLLPGSTTDDVLNTVMSHFTFLQELSITFGKVHSSVLGKIMKKYEKTLTTLEINEVTISPQEDTISNLILNWHSTNLQVLEVIGYSLEPIVFQKLPELYPNLQTLRANYSMDINE